MTTRQRLSARRYVEQCFRPGNAGDYITHDGIQPGDQAVLCCRVSTRQQDHAGNLDAQIRHLTAEVATRRASVVEVVRHVGSGFDPSWVGDAACIARRLNAKVVATTTDRLIRHPDFKSAGTEFERNARAHTEDLEKLQSWTDGVELVTLTAPDAPLSECMGLHKTIGQRIKNRKGGRPKKNPPGYKKERRLRKQPEVIELHAAGLSIRDIARHVDLPVSTVHRWVSRF